MKTERLLLKEIGAEDLDFVYRALSDPRVYRFYGVRFHTLEEAKEQMEWYQNLKDTGTGIWWKILLKDEGVAVGACGFNDWDPEEQSAEVGAWLLPDYWKQGYMNEALKAILDYGFNEMDLQKIIGFIEQGNSNSEQMLDKLGFELDKIELSEEVKEGNPVVQKTYWLEKSNWDASLL